MTLHSLITDSVDMAGALLDVQHSLADISLKLGELWHDLQGIKGELVLRQDVESRLSHVERLLHAALFEEGEDDYPL